MRSQQGSAYSIVLVVFAVLGILVAIAGIGFGGYLLLHARDARQAQPPVALPTPTAQPQQPAIPAKPLPVTDLQLTPSSPTKVLAGQKVTFSLSFTLTLQQPTSIELTLTWQDPDGSQKQGQFDTHTATPGNNTLKDFRSFVTGQGVRPGTIYPILAIVRITGQTYTSSPVIIAVVEPSQAAPPPQPAQPSGPISGVDIVATTPLQVPPGGKVALQVKFTLTAQQNQDVETNIAWREPNGSLVYGTFFPQAATPGANAAGMTLTIGTATQPGTTLPVFGVVRTGGQLYTSQSPVVVTVVAQQAQPPAAPQPQPPVPNLPQPPQPPERPDVNMKTYHEADNRFEIDYPDSWRAQRFEGWVTFYKDSAESTAFIVNPLVVLPGRKSSRDVTSLIIDSLRKKYPDFKPSSLEVKSVISGPQAAISSGRFEARWTNLRGERMRGRFALNVMYLEPVAGVPAYDPFLPPGSKPSQGLPGGKSTTYFMMLAYQAPDFAYDSMEPIFIEMYQSYRHIKGLPAPP